MIDTPWTRDGDHHRWTVPEGWGQGRAVFGGLVAGAAARLSQSFVERPLRTIQTQFLAPVRHGVLEAEFEELRRGKSATITRATLRQDDRISSLFVFTHIEPRPDSIRVPFPDAPEWKPPEQVMQMPYIAGVTPEFTQHYDFRFAEGSMPFTGGTRAHFNGYIRAKEDAGVEVADTLGLVDAWPCPTLTILSRPVAASTVTWTLHLFDPPSPTAFNRYAFRTELAASGFSTSVGRMWNAEGQPVAYSEQTVAVFD
ncbi:MAG: thioesterase family protein [Myxococcota bacterium]